jgi:short-subunit dehydrogenase
MSDVGFAKRYGPWALVVGGSAGLGYSLAAEAARRGLNVALTARRPDVLEAAAARLQREFGVAVRAQSADIGDPEATLRAAEQLTGDVEIGLLAYSAAIEANGWFLDIPLEEHLAGIRGNCITPTILVHRFGREMAARGRGGIALVSSLAAIQGAVLIAGYGAQKAYEWILAEGLWVELRDRGVDVVGSLLGATATERFFAFGNQIVPMPPDQIERDDPALTLQNKFRNPADPDAAARVILDGLGHGPTVFSDAIDRRIAEKIFRMPRADAVGTMARNVLSADFIASGVAPEGTQPLQFDKRPRA